MKFQHHSSLTCPVTERSVEICTPEVSAFKKFPAQLTKTLYFILFILILIPAYSTGQAYKWAKSIGSTSSDNSYSITTDAWGNIYITGYFYNTADFDPGTDTAYLTSVGMYDIFFAKYNSSGNYLWAKSIGSTGFDYGYCITTDPTGSGDIYITGKFNDSADFDPGAGTAILTSTGDKDIFFAKYDSAGNYLWAKNIGSASSDNGHSITVDVSGNVYITGDFYNTADFDPGAGTANLTPVGMYDIFLAKYDSSGNYLWAKRLGSPDFDCGYSITTDESSNVLITGSFQGTVDFDPGPGTANLISAGYDDIFLAKYDPSGNYIWAKNIGSINNDYGFSITTDGSENVYVTGTFYDTADFDPSAGIANLSSAGEEDIFFAKYNSSGSYLWAKRLGSKDNDGGYSITTDGSGNVYITGYLSDTADFDPGPDTANLISAGYDDIFFAKYNSNGSYLWAKRLGSASYERSYSIIAGTSGSVYITGYFQGATDFDPGEGSAYLTGVGGSSDIFFAKYGPCNTISSFTQTATTICEGDSVSFTNTSTEAITYQWQEDSVTFSTSINTSRIFDTIGTCSITLIAAKSSCFDTSGVIITVNPALTDSISCTVTCYNDSTGSATVTPTEGILPFTYLWDDPDSQTDTTATGLAAGLYYVTITDYFGCLTTDSVSIIEAPELTAINSSNKAMCLGTCDGDATVVPSGGKSPYTYAWDDPSFQTTATATGLCAGTFNVTVTDNNDCPITVAAEVSLIRILFLPSAFSPNGDGQNDILYARGDLQSLYLAIYSRWGEKVFETEDQGIGWDGRFRGKPVNSDSYTYYLKATLYHGEVVEETGDVILVR
ncbi:MAG: SBBP repeat-containing protein [Bacteroidota bacterium]